jgi:hypothetical protein
MASEDPDQITSGCPPVHRLCDLGDLDETVDVKVPPTGDDLHAERELLEVALLRRTQTMRLEERNDRLEELVASVDDELPRCPRWSS